VFDHDQVIHRGLIQLIRWSAIGCFDS